MTITVSFWDIIGLASNNNLAKQGIDNWVIRVRSDEDEPTTETFIKEIKRLKPAKDNEENVKVLDITEVPVSLEEFKKLMCRLTDNSWLITRTYDVRKKVFKQENYYEGKYMGIKTAA